MKRFIGRIALFATLLIATGLHTWLDTEAVTLNVPFKNKVGGQVILASEWNSNFTTIESVVNGQIDFALLGIFADDDAFTLTATATADPRPSG